MNQATIRTLSQIEKLVKEEKHDPRQKFMREKDAVTLRDSEGMHTAEYYGMH